MSLLWTSFDQVQLIPYADGKLDVIMIYVMHAYNMAF